MSTEGDLIHVVSTDEITPVRKRLGKLLVWGSTAILALSFLVLGFAEAGLVDFEVSNWRPALYAYVFWAICFCVAQVVTRGEQGKRALFILPSVLLSWQWLFSH